MAVTDLDPQSLVQAHNTGDERAFSQIVRTHHQDLLAHAVSRLHDRAAAEDAVQETFVRAYRSLGRFDGGFHLRAWLHRILTNVCNDEGARRRRDGLLLERVTATSEVAADGADLGIERLDLSRSVVAKALAELPVSYREAVVLRDVQELSYEEVAAATGISPGNARVRVMRGRAALRRALTSSHAVVFGLLPFLRRGGRGGAGVADLQASAASAASAASPSLVAATPTLAASPSLVAGGQLVARVAESAPQVADRVASIPQLLGIVAAVAVPIAAPVVSEHVTAWTARPPAVEAGAAEDAPAPPAPTSSEPTSSAPTSAAPPVVAASVAPTTTTTTSPTTTSSSVSPTTSSTTASTATSSPPATGPVAAVPAATTTTTAAPPRRTFAAGVAGDQLTAVGDQRVELAGPVRLSIGGETVEGRLGGVLELDRSVDEPAPVEERRDGAPRQRPRTFSGELEVQLADGRSFRLVLTDGTLDHPSSGTAMHAVITVFDGCDAVVADGTVGGALDLAEAPLPSAIGVTIDGEGPATTPACG